MGELAELVKKMSLNVPPHATFNKTVPGLADIYSFEIKPGDDTVVYRYDVELSRKVNGEDKSLTKGGGDDGKKGLLRDICLELVNIVFSAFTNGNKVFFVYDNRKNLFTDKRINPVSCEIQPQQMSEETRTFLRSQTVYCVIQPVNEKSHVLNLNDIASSLQKTPEEQSDHSLRTFLEMLTSQPFINAGDHKIVGMGRIFYRQGTKMNTFPAITTHKGLAKGVRIIENGDKTKPVPALVADVKTCAFFTTGNLRQIADEMLHQKGPRFNRNDPKMMESFWADFGQLFKGVSASLSYAPWRVIVIDSVTNRNCQQISFDVEGKSVNLIDYFRIKKNTKIDGRFPAVRQHIDRDSLYPLECLNILPLQRLTIDKMMINDDMGKISRDLLSANATKPDVRYTAIQNEVKQIGDPDGMSAKFMLKFGVKVKGGRNDVQIGMLPLPTIKFGGLEQQQDDRGRFDVRGRYGFLEPSKMLKSWVIGYPRRISEEHFKKFIGDLLFAARNRGMQIPNPHYEKIELAQLNEAMQKFQKENVQFLFYIDNKFVKSHSQLKLAERRYRVLTQHVTLEMAQKAGMASVQNVLNKMNMKLCGLNYLPMPDPITLSKFDLSTGNVLVIGVDTSRPPRATAHELFMLKKQGLAELSSDDPMVVGFCANILKDPRKFCGDYFYQPCKQDVLDENYLVRKMLWTFNQIKANRGKPPSTIVIIRDGISEGMVPNAVKGEFNSFVKACSKFASNWAPKFIYCIVDKRHNKRFFRKQGPNVENTMPGSVIDSKFVRVDMHEFFMQAHFPLKGCSKIPQYIIPVNQVKANNNELLSFFLSLCNMWQIVNLAPALPTPVLQAKELAKRGRNNYMELKHVSPQHIPRIPVGDHQQATMIDYGKLNTMLNYEGAQGLVLTRFNA